MRPIPSHLSRSMNALRRVSYTGIRAARPVALALAAVILTACSDSTGPGDSELTAAEARWRLVQPASNSYVMRQQVQCFCGFAGSEFIVTVMNGAVSAATPAAPPQNGFDTPPLTAFRTVDQLFSEVRNTLGKSGTLKDVTYDPVAGYPTRLSLDPLPNAIDDEVVYVTRGVGAP